MGRIARMKAFGERMLARVRQLPQARQGGAITDRVDALLQRWPAAPADAARELRTAYGEPDEMTSERLIWHHNGSWKRTVVLRDEIPHHFPAAHSDFLAQSVSYRVPPECVTELAWFNGSIVVDRTAGELTAHCDDEAMNILALNLAHEVIRGERSAHEARQAWAEEAAMHAVNPPSAYTVRLVFDPPASDPADTDAPAATGRPERLDGERMADLADPR